MLNTRSILNKLQAVETPFYYYDMQVLHDSLKAVSGAAKKHGYHVHYALKANANMRLLQAVREHGLGADCVSGGEVKRALECGFKPNDVVFAGVGKSDKEIELALNADIFCFNCESKQELEILNELAQKSGKTARIALRINPNVNAHTHHYITTGLEENKFGINLWEMPQVLDLLKTLSSIDLIGIHFHIGSQITDLTVFKNLCIKVNEIQQWFRERGIMIKHLNVGGGLGINYHEPEKEAVLDFEKFFGIFAQFLQVNAQQEVHFELGRSIVAQCGSLISRVLYIKNGVKTNFAILDAGMTDLIRPALYQAFHKIENISKDGAVADSKYDVVGPICESSDCFGKAVDLPDTQRGDLISIRSAGAYGEVMASGYNLRELPKSVYSDQL